MDGLNVKIDITGSVNSILNFVSLLNGETVLSDSSKNWQGSEKKKDIVESFSAHIYTDLMEQGFYEPTILCMIETIERYSPEKKFVQLIPNESEIVSVSINKDIVDNLMEYDWSMVQNNSFKNFISQLSANQPLDIPEEPHTEMADFDYDYQHMVNSGEFDVDKENHIILPDEYLSAVSEVLHAVNIAEAFDYTLLGYDDPCNDIIATALTTMDKDGLAHFNDVQVGNNWSLLSGAVSENTDSAGLFYFVEDDCRSGADNRATIMMTNMALFCYNEKIYDSVDFFEKVAVKMREDFPNNERVKELFGDDRYATVSLMAQVPDMIWKQEDDFLNTVSAIKQELTQETAKSEVQL